MLAANLLQADDGLSFKAKGKETIEVRFNGRLQAQYDGLSMSGEEVPITFTFVVYSLALKQNSAMESPQRPY